ncbi:hypothetical protein NXF25_004687 [Crotalus adamanteus]|uniref:CCHC-type domain-containing protein n=1 Tax=Crotalus adamanteus TaxID=8729 RepID=A0AAW1BV97_CROAD
MATSFFLLPEDWKGLFNMILTSSQYVVWESEWKKECQKIVSAWPGRNAPTVDQLTGSGNYTYLGNQQAMNPLFYSHSALAAKAALTRVDDPQRGTKGSFVKIFQGPNQPYGEFVDQLQKAISREITNLIAQEELLKKLAFENANEDCRRVLQPLMSKPDAGLADYIQACRIVGTNAFNMETLAMALQKAGSNGQTEGKAGNCFNCGKPGHFKNQCRAPGGVLIKAGE